MGTTSKETLTNREAVADTGELLCLLEETGGRAQPTPAALPYLAAKVPSRGHRVTRLWPRTPGTPSCPGTGVECALTGSPDAARGPAPAGSIRSEREPRDGYLRREADEAQKGRVVAARAEGSVVVALPAAAVAQHEVRGGGEVENSGQVDAAIEELWLPRADALDHRAVVRRGHDQLVLPAGPKAGGTGRQWGQRRGGVCRPAPGWGEPCRGCRAAGTALTWPPQRDGRRGAGGARPSLGMGRCRGRCGS